MPSTSRVTFAEEDDFTEISAPSDCEWDEWRGDDEEAAGGSGGASSSSWTRPESGDVEFVPEVAAPEELLEDDDEDEVWCASAAELRRIGATPGHYEAMDRRYRVIDRSEFEHGLVS